MWSETQGVLSTMDDTKANFSADFFHLTETDNRVGLWIQFDTTQETCTLDLYDCIGEFRRQLFEFFDQLNATFTDILSQFRGDLIKNGDGCLKRTRIRCHGVAINSDYVEFGGSRTQSQN